MERQFYLEQLLLDPEGVVAEVRCVVWAGHLRISLAKLSVSSIVVAHLPFSFDIQEVNMACGDPPEIMGSQQ